MKLAWESAVVIALRDMRGNLTQGELAARAGVGVKTLSSYEADYQGRLHAAKVVHLRKLVAACGWSLVSFFAYVDDLIRESTP